MKKFRPIFIFLLGGFFFACDRLLKYEAVQNPGPYYFSKPWIAWEFFSNKGIAFGIPLPWFAAFFYTPIILLFIILHYKKNIQKSWPIQLGTVLILCGALSNLIDRIQYHITIDYFRIFTSIINLADVSIVLGTAILLWIEFKRQ